MTCHHGYISQRLNKIAGSPTQAFCWLEWGFTLIENKCFLGAAGESFMKLFPAMAGLFWRFFS